MLYHYTSVDVLNSIIRSAESEKGICFWATRFDCFTDKEEYKLGIAVIKRLLPRFEDQLRPDRRLASSFEWEDIYGNVTLPFPYIVSFTNRHDNAYMWEKYAGRDSGVVLGIDDSKNVTNEYTKNLFVKRCLYLGEKTDDDLYEEIKDEYLSSASNMLTGPNNNLAFAFLSTYPQLFVSLIGRYLLAYVAPRFKWNRYNPEEETRAILAPPRPEMKDIVDYYEDAAKAFGSNTEDVKRMTENEMSRTRKNGQIVYYQELFLPGNLLKSVTVANEELIEQVAGLVSDKGFKDVDVKAMKLL